MSFRSVSLLLYTTSRLSMEYINVQNTLHHACNERVYMRVDVYESWEARVCIRISSTLMLRSNANKSCMRVDWILPRAQRKLSSQFEPVQSRVGGHMRARVAWELTEYYRVRSENSHHNLNQFKVELAVTCERELHESWLNITACAAKTLITIWTSSKSSWRSHASESWNSHQLSSLFDCMRLYNRICYLVLSK
jgi:hypothetical protein